MENINFSELMRHAILDIKEFDIQHRTELDVFDRSLPYYIMSYHKEGEAVLRIADKTYHVSPGTVMFIPPYTTHDHFKISSQKTTFLWWHFTFEIVNVIDILKLFQLPYTFSLKRKKVFENVFMEFWESTKRSSFIPTTILKHAKSLELLYLILEDTMQIEYPNTLYSNSTEFMDLLVNIIQFPEKNITLKKLSEELHMHPTYISNRFKKLFGQSPKELQLSVRIEKAKSLLRASDLTITDIAFKLGFNGLTNFTRSFTSSVGLSPTNYRKIVLLKEAK